MLKLQGETKFAITITMTHGIMEAHTESYIATKKSVICNKPTFMMD